MGLQSSNFRYDLVNRDACNEICEKYDFQKLTVNFDSSDAYRVNHRPPEAVRQNREIYWKNQ